MTNQELMALPEVGVSRLEHRTEVRPDGTVVHFPVMTGPHVALYQGPDDGVFYDATGKAWLVGQLGGKRVRQEARFNFFGF